MAINWRILERQEAKEIVFNIINNENEFDKILVNKSNQPLKYFIEPEKAMRIPNGQPIYSCYDQETVKRLIRKTIQYYDDIISDWLVNAGAMLKLKISNTENIGYKIDLETGNITQLSNAVISIRGNIGDNVEYGFCIDSVIPEEE